MILIEVEGGAAPRFRLEFHPRLTIVAGLDEVQRRELSMAIRNVLTGQGRFMRLTVELEGAPRELRYDDVLNYGLDKLDFDNIINRGSRAASAARGAVGGDPVAEADSDLQRALAVVQNLEAQLEAIPPEPHRVDPGELVAAEGQYTAAHSRAESLRKRWEDTGASAEDLDPEQESAKLENLKASVEQHIAEQRGALADKPGDLDAIRRAVSGASSDGSSSDETVRSTVRVAELAGEWNRTINHIKRLEHQARPPQWLVDQIKSELDDAVARHGALAYQAREGADARAVLERAHARVVEAQAAWAEIEHSAAGQMAEAMDHRDALAAEISELLGRTVAPNEILDALSVRHRELQNRSNPAQELVRLLADAGVTADVATAHDTARRLLVGREQQAKAKPAAQRALAQSMVDLQEVNRQLAEVRGRLARRGNESDSDAERVQYDDAVALERAAEATLRNLQTLAGQSASFDPALGNRLRAELDAAHEAAARAQQVYEATVFEATGGEPPATMADQENKPWWVGGGPQVATPAGNGAAASLETYLLTRAANMRMLVSGESMPLVVDSVFEGVSVDETLAALDALSKVSPIIQIVYLAGNDAAEKWAKRQDIYTTAVVRLERA